ncbi:MAG: hypothetical protein QXU12_06250, partial [Nitrososphaerota archaeon]
MVVPGAGGGRMVRLRKVAEIAELSSPEELSRIAEEAMRMMGSDDELERLEAQGMLDSSKCVARVWEFYWPPKVYVTRIFDDLRAAESVAEAHRSLGIKVWKVFRRLDDRVLPAVKMEWEAYYLLGEFFREAFDVEWSRLDRKMNKIVRRYLAEKSEKRALRMLAREAGRMGA